MTPVEELLITATIVCIDSYSSGLFANESEPGTMSESERTATMATVECTGIFEYFLHLTTPMINALSGSQRNLVKMRRRCDGRRKRGKAPVEG